MSLTSRIGRIGSAAVLVLGSALFVVAAPDEKPKAAAPVAAAPAKLVKPWSELTSLNDEQKAKIHEIHVKALAQINEIEKQEKADIMAILTDPQKTELKEVAAKENKDAADKRAAAKTKGGPTTAPVEKKG